MMLKTSKIAACLLSGALVALTTPAHAQTGQYDGVNWADSRDNFVNDALVLSGTTATDSYSTLRTTGQRVAQQFQSKLGANTIRIPINPTTASSTKWAAYRGVIDGIRAQGFTVIIAYWEGANSKDGKIDNQQSFDTMWSTVVSAYSSDSGVLFEPMNEPHGYTLAQWTSAAANWLARFPSLPRSRVVIDGTGYSDSVTGVCADSRFSGTRLGLHNYAFWATRSYSQWLTDWQSRIGSCASRTIITEVGSTMNSGLDYGSSSSNNEVTYMQAGMKTARDNSLGVVYWPGLRDGDPYSLTTRSGSGGSLTLNIVNTSGANSLRWGWGF
jgi:hypothetical protein